MEKRKLNILFITNEYPIYEKKKIISYGGQATYIKNISRLLSKKKNISVTVWVLSNKIKSYKDKKVNIREIGFNLSFLGKYAGIINSILVSFCILFYKKKKFNVIQYPSYFPLGFFIFLPKNTLKVCRISGVTKLWREIEINKKNFLHLLSDYLEKKLVIKSDKVFAPSKKISNIAEKLYCKKIEVCTSPVLKLFNEKPKIIVDIKKYILFVGSLNRTKGIDILAKAMKKIFLKEKKINLVLIGKDNDNNLNYIYKILKNYKSKIYYFGVLKSSHIAEFYKKAIAVIIPSRIDNLPNVMLEALAFKKIIITLKNSSVDEFIKDKQNGFVAKHKNHKSLFRSISIFLNHSSSQKKKLKRNIEKLYNSLVSRDYAREMLHYYGLLKK